MTKIQIRNRIVDDNTASFYKWFGMTCTCPNDVLSMLNEANGDDITLDIASPGGSVAAGVEIYTALAEYEGNVTAKISTACSAATLIACAADTVKMSDAGMFMIHNAWSYAEGDYRSMDETSDALKAINNSIINAYERKTGLSREELQGYMDNTTYFTAQDAKELGFVDEIMTFDKSENVDMMSVAASDDEIVPYDKAMEAMQAISLVEKAGGAESLLAILNEQQTEQTVSEINSQEEQNMTLQEFLNENPEAATAYAEAIDEAVNEAKAEAKADGLSEGVAQENDRLKALDELSNSVSAEALAEAKYGENRTDAKTLAYETMKANAKAGAEHFNNAILDSQESGVEDVGTFEPDTGEEVDNEAAELASYINSKKGAK